MQTNQANTNLKNAKNPKTQAKTLKHTYPNICPPVACTVPGAPKTNKFMLTSQHCYSTAIATASVAKATCYGIQSLSQHLPRGGQHRPWCVTSSVQRTCCHAPRTYPSSLCCTQPPAIQGCQDYTSSPGPWVSPQHKQPRAVGEPTTQRLAHICRAVSPQQVPR